MAEKNFFEELYDVDVRDRMYQKQGLSYIPWSTSWSEVCKVHPDATYEFKKFGENQVPYVETPLGLMVYTSVTIDGITREMCLPVMDSSNKAMKSEPYTYTVGKGDRAVEKTVNAATMFDVNKTTMRCFAKNLAMFGLGLHLWSKEEAPESVIEAENLRKEIMTLITKKCALSDDAKEKVANICKEADENANGDPRLIEDVEVLKELKKRLLSVRK